MTCTGARLAGFFTMECLLSVPRDVRRSAKEGVTKVLRKERTAPGNMVESRRIE